MDINFLIHHFNHQLIDSVWTFHTKKMGLYFKHAPYPWLIFDFDNQNPTISYSLHTVSINPLLQFKHPLDPLIHRQSLSSIEISDEGILFRCIDEEENLSKLCFSSMPYHPSLTLNSKDSLLYHSNPNHKDVKYKVVLSIKETNLSEDLHLIHFEVLISILTNHITKKKNRLKYLNQDKEKHASLLFYKDVADDILMHQKMDAKYLKDTFDLTLPLHTFTSLGSLVKYLFHQYKRSKQGIQTIEKNLEDANQEILELENFLLSLSPYSLDKEKLLRHKLESLHLLNSKEKKVSLVKAENPYIFTYKDTTYSFGKNKKQNHHLTFHLAQKKYIFVHIKDFPGSHIIIHRQDFDHESLIFAGQLSLFLSKQTSGLITYTKVGSLKATHTEGMVIVKNPKEMKINLDHQIPFETIIKNATRY